MRLDIKTTLIILLTIAVIVLSTCKGCLQKKYDKLKSDCGNNQHWSVGKVFVDTVYIHDTVSFSDHAPIPYKIETPQIVLRRVFDTLYLETLGKTDTLYADTLIKKYYTTNYYQRKFKNQYGEYTTHDTVFNNNLIGNGLDIDLKLPVVEKTVTVTKPKAALYFGISASGNRQGLCDAGLSLMYQSPRTLNYSVGAFFNADHKFNYNATIYFPLTKKY